MAKTARTIIPAKSTDPRDKLLACLNWPVGLSKREGDPSYEAAPIYYDAAWEWYRSLSLGQRDTVSTIIAVWSSMPTSRREAKRLATTLPPAPRCPL